MALVLYIVISFVRLIFDTKAVGLLAVSYRSSLFKEIERMIHRQGESMVARVAGKILNLQH